jgi:hypothetical protein
MSKEGEKWIGRWVVTDLNRDEEYAKEFGLANIKPDWLKRK